MIFFNYPKEIYKLYKKEINAKILQVLESGIYVNSKELNKFEINFSKYIKTKYSIGVGNATDAIYLSLLSLNIKKGDEVITVSHTATGTVAAISNLGAKPIFLDIDINNFNMDLNLLEKKINYKTKAIVIVHLYGQSCDMKKLMSIAKKNNIPVIEDCSQATGASFKNKKLGSYGTLSCFSFFPTKNLSCIGDGGMITCNNKAFKKKIDCLREYGWNQNRNANTIGINSRLDEIQASILNVKLKYLDRDNLERRLIAKYYNLNIKNDKIIKPIENLLSFHVYHLYVIKIKNRSKFIKEMNKKNIFTGIHYQKAIHHQKLFLSQKNYLPVTDQVVKSILSLPIYPGLSRRDLKKIVNVINDF